MAATIDDTFPLAKPSWSVVRRMWRQNPPLAFVGGLMVAVLIVTVLGMIIDPRLVLNESAWLKPAKFAISISIYSFTLLWLLTYIKDHRHAVSIASWIIAGALALEQVIISVQAWRGVRSHFNYTTPTDALLFQIMAVAIVVLWLANLAVVVVLLRQRHGHPVMRWALRIGLIIALVGMVAAFFMPQPTPGQRELMRTTGSSNFIGAHAVGVDDGGPGLPLVGWSTVGGDLRVPHFVGIHALQAMPMIAWLLLRVPAGRLALTDRVRLMMIAGVGGLGLEALLIWQALRGQSVIAPDGQTLLAFFGGVAVLGLAAAIVILSARRRQGVIPA